MARKGTSDFFRPRLWYCVRLATNEPLTPNPQATLHDCKLLARAILRMTFKRDNDDDVMHPVHYVMRTDAQVDAILMRDYAFKQYELKEIPA